MSLPGLFVVGTDTGGGENLRLLGSRANLARGRTPGWRPQDRWHRVRSGEGEGMIADDTRLLIDAQGDDVPAARVTPLVYEEPLAPPVAARRLGKPLEMSEVLSAVSDSLGWWSERADVMVVEGVGGLLCPLAEGATVADLAVALDYPLLIVAHRGLGTLNHTLLTVEAARSRGLRIAGVILNGARPTVDPVAEGSNAEELTRRLGNVAILADWPHFPGFFSGSIAPESGGWYDLISPPRSGMGFPSLPENETARLPRSLEGGEV